jgi:heme-degrading monooxygenase HmoA
MFIAMNRFKVIKGCEQDFEQVWRRRESYLGEMPGFIVFHLLKGPVRDDHVLYSSHTMWRSHADFEAWTKSEQFRKAHAGAGGNKPLFQGHPEFEGFQVVQEERADGSRVEAAE